MLVTTHSARTGSSLLNLSSNTKKQPSTIQIYSVSASSSCENLSTDGSLVSWSAGETRGSTPLDRRQKWLTVKCQLTQALELLQSSQTDDDYDEFEDEAMRLELQELALRVQKQFTSPHETIQNIIQAHHIEAALRYAVHHQLAEHIPSAGSISYTDLAARTSTDAFQCKRILRLLSTYYVFAEDSTMRVMHTPASLYLLDDDVQSWIEYSTTDSITSSLSLSDALSKWPSSRDPAQSAFSLAHSTDLPMFEHFAQTPGKLDRFRRAMTGMSRSIAQNSHHAVRGYKWSSLYAGAHLVDVGGGDGHVSRVVRQSHPSLKITVQDLGVAFDHTKDGIAYSKYDFFVPQPIRGAEIYLMRQVLHDWSDDFATKIVRNQVSAMAPHSKLLIMDMVMPEPGDWRLAEERRARATDVTMLSLFNSEERTLSRWLELMQLADKRLKLTNTTRPAGSILTVLEFSLS